MDPWFGVGLSSPTRAAAGCAAVGGPGGPLSVSSHLVHLEQFAGLFRVWGFGVWGLRCPLYHLDLVISGAVGWSDRCGAAAVAAQLWEGAVSESDSELELEEEVGGADDLDLERGVGWGSAYPTDEDLSEHYDSDALSQSAGQSAGQYAGHLNVCSRSRHAAGDAAAGPSRSQLGPLPEDDPAVDSDVPVYDSDQAASAPSSQLGLAAAGTSLTYPRSNTRTHAPTHTRARAQNWREGERERDGTAPARNYAVWWPGPSVILPHAVWRLGQHLHSLGCTYGDHEPHAHGVGRVSGQLGDLGPPSKVGGWGR